MCNGIRNNCEIKTTVFMNMNDKNSSIFVCLEMSKTGAESDKKNIYLKVWVEMKRKWIMNINTKLIITDIAAQ